MPSIFYRGELQLIFLVVNAPVKLWLETVKWTISIDRKMSAYN